MQLSTYSQLLSDSSRIRTYKEGSSSTIARRAEADAFADAVLNDSAPASAPGTPSFQRSGTPIVPRGSSPRQSGRLSRQSDVASDLFSQSTTLVGRGANGATTTTSGTDHVVDRHVKLEPKLLSC